MTGVGIELSQTLSGQLIKGNVYFRWFKSVDWEEVYQRELKPPIVPKVSSDGDTRNFDNYPEEDWRKVEPVTERQLAMFSDF